MKKYIALLRGINLGNHNKLPMLELKKILSNLELSHIETDIQSGNAVFSSSKKVSENTLANQISEAITTQFGFDVPVLVFDAHYLSKLVSENPFIKWTHTNINFLHITFLKSEPDSINVLNLDTSQFQPDQWELATRAIFLYCPGGYGNTKLRNQFFEKKLKVQATTRNWKTCLKLLEMASS